MQGMLFYLLPKHAADGREHPRGGGGGAARAPLPGDQAAGVAEHGVSAAVHHHGHEAAHRERDVQQGAGEGPGPAVGRQEAGEAPEGAEGAAARGGGDREQEAEGGAIRRAAAALAGGHRQCAEETPRRAAERQAQVQSGAGPAGYRGVRAPHRWHDVGAQGVAAGIPHVWLHAAGAAGAHDAGRCAQSRHRGGDRHARPGEVHVDCGARQAGRRRWRRDREAQHSHRIGGQRRADPQANAAGMEAGRPRGPAAGRAAALHGPKFLHGARHHAARVVEDRRPAAAGRDGGPAQEVQAAREARAPVRRRGGGRRGESAQEAQAGGGRQGRGRRRRQRQLQRLERQRRGRPQHHLAQPLVVRRRRQRLDNVNC